MDSAKLLEYVPFRSIINPGFWHKLTDLKLNVDKLNEPKRNIWGYYSILEREAGPLLEVDSTSFNNVCDKFVGLCMQGMIINKNTVEQFKDCNKTELIQEEGLRFWNNVVDGSCIKNPSLINTFLILTFAELKKYHYYYWFAFPTPANVNVQLEKIQKITELLNDEQLINLHINRSKLEVEQQTFFLIRRSDLAVLKFNDIMQVDDKNNLGDHDDYYFAYGDCDKSNEHASWPIRNYVVFLLHHCPALHGKTLRFLAYRLSRGVKVTCSDSLILNVIMPDFGGDLTSVLSATETSGWIGWERNERGKLGPRMANMKESMDPKCIAESSVDLNIKLMKWRALPNIDLDKIKNTKCLLLGAGTLGCSVARVLLGWGVRKIDFVDSSTVSYSNPVRQSLFNFEDCLEHKPKALAAADNLKKIFPGVESQGHQFFIPMPGHPIGTALLNQTKDAVEKLTELIKGSDVVFLLMDSRESRWLPTVLGMHFRKIVINAALGFDTYLVMRHGVRYTSDVEFEDFDGLKTLKGNELGCYFCNDVTAPGNSLKDRTLDQQCTVTRPGISQIAGALAVELAISLLTHEHGPLAPAYFKAHKDSKDTEIPCNCILGILPYSIRGFLSTFTHVLPATEKHKQCIACSELVLKEYAEDEFEFLRKVFDSSKYLEELTGLNEIYDVESNEIWDMDELMDSDV